MCRVGAEGLSPGSSIPSWAGAATLELLGLLASPAPRCTPVSAHFHLPRKQGCLAHGRPTHAAWKTLASGFHVTQKFIIWITRSCRGESHSRGVPARVGTELWGERGCL